MIDKRFHLFSHDVSSIELPGQFTYPFRYVPHPLCVMAAQEVRQCAERHSEWLCELNEGKMLGVLVAKDCNGQVGFLAAFSGNLCGSNNHYYFVPPVYNLLAPCGEFKKGEDEISHINQRIVAIERSLALEALNRQYDATKQCHSQIENDYRQQMKKAKERRETLRQSRELSKTERDALIAESQFQKAELKRLKKRHDEELNEIRVQIDIFEHEIQALKTERKLKSERLQQRIFHLFQVKNAQGEEKDLIDIFKTFYKEHHVLPRYSSMSLVPPSGAGECCAPKLLQYAYNHHLHPLCMAEFWWGKSPIGEIRHHGHFYPACRSKCLPILNFMLRGLDVEPNPLENYPDDEEMPVIVYEDDWLVAVDKPAGMLSTQGKLHDDSLQARLKRQFPHITTLTLAHRLDMDTSGIVLVAKSMEVYKELQRQFVAHTVKKCYIAVVAGNVVAQEGVISLPLRCDIENRPRQLVDLQHGKKAVTRYRVLERKEGKVRIEFQPITGRTHQLRVHASSPQGLNAPIVGDMLYGQADSRLHLHAQSVTFIHPITRKTITIQSPAGF